MNDGLMVSIWCVTYNHEKYIRDAIESFLMQKTSFNFEIVIHDDASTDGTITILKEYEKNNPDLIRVIYETENQYSKFRYPPQFFYPLMRRESKGKYIAMCEGDDYWTDVNKLQIQIDYMENHLQCVMTGHDAEILNCQVGEKKRLMLFSGETDVPADVLINGTGDLTTASLVFRREMLDMDEIFWNIDVGDYPLKLYCLSKGKIHYFEDAMSVYRYLSECSWSSNQKSDRSSYLIRWINKFVFLDKYDRYTKGIYTSIIKKLINRRLNTLLQEFCKLSIEQFEKLCWSCDQEGDCEAHKYYIGMINLFKQYHDTTYVDKKVYKFILGKKYVFIYGVGTYGKLVADQFANNHIEYEGFVVSDNQVEEKMYQGKKVWKIGQLPYMKKEIGIVIAVRPQLKEEILTVLQDKNIENYIYPFEIDCDKLII